MNYLIVNVETKLMILNSVFGECNEITFVGIKEMDGRMEK